MPAVSNELPPGILYEFAPGLNHTVSPYNHLARQACNVWALGSISSFAVPIALSTKAVTELASYAIFGRTFWKNAPGHSLPFVGKVINWMWQNPIKSAILSIIGIVPSIGFNVKYCNDEHMYTLRSLIHTNMNQSVAQYIDQIFVAQLVEVNILSNPLYKLQADQKTRDEIKALHDPKSHMYVHLNQTRISEMEKRVKSDPKFASIHEKLMAGKFKLPNSDLFTLALEHMEVIQSEKKHDEL